MNGLLNSIIVWCDKHEGFVSATLTLVYLTLTLVYVVATIGLVWLGRRQLKTALEIEHARTRPLVVLDLLDELPLIYMTIKNFGLTAARNVKVDVTPQLRCLFGEPAQKHFERAEAIPVIESGIIMLPPGKEIRGRIGHYPHVYSYSGGGRFEGRIHYSNADLTATYDEPVFIDLSAIEMLLKPQRQMTHDAVNVLKKLHEELQSAVRILSKRS